MSTDFHARKLLRELERRGKKLSPLLILTHDHPDPDSLASAWALAHLAQHVAKIRARIVYGGIIGRKENRMMAERLMIPASPLRKGELDGYEHVALVDTQPPFRNNRFPPRRKPDLIIDHHPRHPETGADLILIDETVGATTTMLSESLLLAGVKVSTRLATAIVYGIGSETQNLGREATARDMAAYRAFWPKANMKTLWSISYPKRSAQFFSDLARGTRNAFSARGVLITHLGAITTPDRVAQIADFLLTYEKARWTVVTGRYAGRLHISLRTSDAMGGAGRLLKKILGGGNRGGGHGMIAGGNLEVGLDASEERWREAEETVAAGFLESQGLDSSPADRVYPFRDDLF